MTETTKRGRRGRISNERKREIATTVVLKLTRQVLDWQAEHAPAKPAENLRFFKDQIMCLGTEDAYEQEAAWRGVRDILEETDPYFLAYVGIKKRNDPYDMNTGPWVWVNGVDPALRVSLDAHNYRVKKGMVRSDRKRAVRKAQRMGEREYVSALSQFGVKPKELAKACRAFGFELPDKLERLLLEAPDPEPEE